MSTPPPQPTPSGLWASSICDRRGVTCWGLPTREVPSCLLDSVEKELRNEHFGNRVKEVLCAVTPELREAVTCVGLCWLGSRLHEDALSIHTPNRRNESLEGNRQEGEGG